MVQVRNSLMFWFILHFVQNVLHVGNHTTFWLFCSSNMYVFVRYNNSVWYKYTIKHGILVYIAFSIEHASYRKQYGLLVYIPGSVRHDQSKNSVESQFIRTFVYWQHLPGSTERASYRKWGCILIYSSVPILRPSRDKPINVVLPLVWSFIPV